MTPTLCTCNTPAVRHAVTLHAPHPALTADELRELRAGQADQ